MTKLWKVKMRTMSKNSRLKAGVPWRLWVPSTRRTSVSYAFDSQMLALPYSLSSENRVGGKIHFWRCIFLCYCRFITEVNLEQNQPCHQPAEIWTSSVSQNNGLHPVLTCNVGAVVFNFMFLFVLSPLNPKYETKIMMFLFNWERRMQAVKPRTFLKMSSNTLCDQS